MASEDVKTLGHKCTDHRYNEWSIDLDDSQHNEGSLASDDHEHTNGSITSYTGMSNVERLLLDLQNKFDRQDEKLDNIQQSFSGLEDRLCKRLNRQDRKLDTIQISFNGLDDRVCMRLNTQDETFDNLQQSFGTLGDRVCKRLDQEKYYMRDRLSDAMKMILVRLAECTPMLGDTPSQRLKKEAQEQLCQPNDIPDTMGDSDSEVCQSIKTLLQVHDHALLSGVTDHVNRGFSSLREVTVQKLEREKQEMLTEKDFFREQLYKALAEVLVHVQDIKKCVSQDEENVSWNFDLDEEETDITLDDIKNALDKSKTEFALEFLKLKDALMQELHSNQEAVEKTEDEIKQEVTNLNKSTQSMIDKLCIGIATDLNTARDEIVNDVQKGINNSYDVVKTDLIGSIEASKQAVITEAMQVGRELKDMITKETSEIKNTAKKMHDDIISHISQVKKDLKTQLTISNSEVKTGFKESQNSTMAVLTIQRENIVREVHTDMDKRMQWVYRDLCDVIEKECQLTREWNYWSGGVHRQEKYYFYFQLTEFGQRVGTDLTIYSCPWHIPQFATCLKGFVRFETDGTLSIWLFNGRNPQVVGLRPKPKRSYTYRVVITNNDQGNEKVANALTPGLLDEITQRPQVVGYKLQSFSCEELMKEGFVVNDTLSIKYKIGVE